MVKIANKAKHPMSEVDKVDWKLLYDYVRYNVLGYDENQSLSRNMVLRLKGLVNNKYMANNKTTDTANYSFAVILNTFKYCSIDIKNALRTHKFTDENHKFNYIIKIVESKLNTVYLRMKESEATRKEKIRADSARVNEYKNNFVATPTKERKKNYDDMW